MVFIWCILLYIDAHSNFGTWNCWNANLSNGLIYDVSYSILLLEFWNLELLERKFKSWFLYGVSYYILMHIEILELGTVGTQI